MKPELFGTAALAAAALTAFAGGSAAAQSPLDLGQALELADRGAYAVRIARGEATERSAGTLAALRGILPALRVESGLMRTTDPIGAFGTTLRQRTITQADFNPATLNHPAVAEDWTGALVAEIPLVNADAWIGRNAAGNATAAARAMVDWERLSTRAGVVRAWFGATLAGEKVRTLEEGTRAAHAHVRQAELMAEQGLVTRSDALLASVKAGEVDAMLAEARGEVRTARRGLATLLGRPDLSVELPASLPGADAVRSVATAVSAPADDPALLGTRADVRAAQLGLEAAGGDVLRTRAAWLPRLNGMARMEWHSADGVYQGKENWSVGVVAQWSPFAGAGQLADHRAAAGRRDAAQARAEAASANARMELGRTADALAVALERLTIAERAVDQATEAHRIVTKKYEGGLATVVELLDASATETRTRLEYAHTLYTVIAAGADHALARGEDPGQLAALDTPSASDVPPDGAAAPPGAGSSTLLRN